MAYDADAAVQRSVRNNTEWSIKKKLNAFALNNIKQQVLTETKHASESLALNIEASRMSR